MINKIVVAVALTLAVTTLSVHAQDWGDGDGYGRMQWLRQACDNGDDRACWKLGQIQRRWRDGGQWGGGGWGGGGQWGGGGWGGGGAPSADPKVARCLAIENNYNDCVRQRKNCAGWLYELQANNCF